MILSHIKWWVKSILEIIDSKIRSTIIFDCFNYWKFTLVNLVHKFPRTSPLVGDLLNLKVKKKHLVFLTVFLNCSQSFIYLVALYLSRSLLQFMSYQLLEYFVILMIFKFFVQIFSIELANSAIMLSRWLMSDMLWVLIILNASINFLTKICSSLLSLIIVYFLVWIC